MPCSARLRASTQHQSDVTCRAAMIRALSCSRRAGSPPSFVRCCRGRARIKLRSNPGGSLSPMHSVQVSQGIPQSNQLPVLSVRDWVGTGDAQLARRRRGILGKCHRKLAGARLRCPVGTRPAPQMPAYGLPMRSVFSHWPGGACSPGGTCPPAGLVRRHHLDHPHGAGPCPPRPRRGPRPRRTRAWL